MGQKYKWSESELEIGGKPIGIMRAIDYTIIDDLDSSDRMIAPAHAHWDKRDLKVTEALENLVKVVRETEQAFRLARGGMDYPTTMIRHFQHRIPPLRFRSGVPRQLSRTRRKQRLTRLQRRNKRQNR